MLRLMKNFTEIYKIKIAIAELQILRLFILRVHAFISCKMIFFFFYMFLYVQGTYVIKKLFFNDVFN